MEGDGKKLTVSERDEQRVVSGEAGSEEQQSAVSDQEARGAESEEHGMSEAQPKERAAAEVQSEDCGAAESQSSERETSESQLQESARLHCGVEGTESRDSSGSPPCLEMAQLIIEQIHKNIQQLLDLLFDKMLQIIVKKWPVGQKSTHSDDQMTLEEGSRESSVGPRSSEVSGSAETESLNKTILKDMLQLTMFLRTVLGISIDSNSSITDTSDFSSMLSSLGEIWQDWKSLKANPLDFLTSLATAKKKDSDKKSSDVEKSPGLKDEEQTGAESARQEQEQKQEQDSAESRVGGGTFETISVSGGEGDETRN
ncbi:uncharacterized protein LOC122246089 [Penaeus japonicus]|uniref:uncharacterized protein LOC122246089 n=1 Tax=Penaeus japonicus TaxID=27405 RepID=UPI001C711943|nr:uncharacterized protein LOC122246089 [Penaeus japonicus]